MAHASKLHTYAARYKAKGLTIHLAVNTFGGWHSTALKVIACLGCQLARATDYEQVMVVRHLRQQLGVLLMWDNVTMLGACVPSFIP